MTEQIEFGSLKEVPIELLTRVLGLIGEGGIVYDGCQLVTKFDGLNLGEDGRLHAINFYANDPEVNRYHCTLVTRTRPNGTTFRDLMIVQHSNGDKIGDVVIVVRLFPDGRYRVEVQQQEYMISETEAMWKPRAKRSSAQNPRQAIKRKPDIDMPEGTYADPGRLAGKYIRQHFSEVRWGPELKDSDFVDIFDYADAPDSLGQGTLFRALKYMPERTAHEIIRQMHNREAVKLPRKSKKSA